MLIFVPSKLVSGMAETVIQDATRENVEEKGKEEEIGSAGTKEVGICGVSCCSTDVLAKAHEGCLVESSGQ